jgi:hypothetical protein
MSALGKHGCRYHFNSLKPKHSVTTPTAKKTPHFAVTNINWLKLFKEIIAINSGNHAKPINPFWKKCIIIDH